MHKPKVFDRNRKLDNLSKKIKLELFLKSFRAGRQYRNMCYLILICLFCCMKNTLCIVWGKLAQDNVLDIRCELWQILANPSLEKFPVTLWKHNTRWSKISSMPQFQYTYFFNEYFWLLGREFSTPLRTLLQNIATAYKSHV